MLRQHTGHVAGTGVNVLCVPLTGAGQQGRRGLHETLSCGAATVKHLAVCGHGGWWTTGHGTRGRGAEGPERRAADGSEAPVILNCRRVPKVRPCPCRILIEGR